MATIAVVCGLRRRTDDPVLALLCIAIFQGIGLAAIALGRTSFGTETALNSRYVTPAALAWFASAISVCLLFRPEHQRFATTVTAAAMVLINALWMPTATWAVQDRLSPLGQTEAAMLSDVDDPAAFEKAFLGTVDRHSAVAELREAKISVFHEPWAAWLGLPLSILGPESHDCAGTIAFERAVASGFRVEGEARRLPDGTPIRRIVITDDANHVVGHGMGPISSPHSSTGTWWVGYTRSTAPIHAYGVLAGDFCRLA